jgi:hypothetical protein
MPVALRRRMSAPWPAPVAYLDTADGLLPWLPAKLEYLQAC